MLDFVKITVKHKNSSVEITPCFKVIRSKDLMIRGNSFYAIWDEELQRWSTDEFDAVRLIDEMTMTFVEDNHLDGIAQLLVNADNCLIDMIQMKKQFVIPISLVKRLQFVPLFPMSIPQ